MTRDYGQEIEAVLSLQTRLQSQIDEHKEQVLQAAHASKSNDASDATMSPAAIATQLVELLKAQQGLREAQPYLRATQSLQEATKTYQAATSTETKLACLRGLEDKHAELQDSSSNPRLSQMYRLQIDAWWQTLQTDARTSLRDALTQVAWPSELPESAGKVLEQPFATALSLHKSQKLLPDVLLPFDTMAEAVKARFLYHFSSRRATNRLDKPEWFLQHLLAVLDLHYMFMQQQIQPILDDQFPLHALSAVHELIRAMLPIVDEKIAASRKLLSQKPTLLSHFIAETHLFDERLRLEFGFVQRDFTPWSGITQLVLEAEVFDAWLALEQEFAESKMRELLDAEDAWEIPEEIDPLADGSIEIRPNASSRQVDDMLESLTQHFSPLADLGQRQRFIDTIVLKLLQTYHDRIQDSTEVFEVMTSGFSGGFPSADVAGKTGLRRLCRQLSGTSNVLVKIKDMAEDPFYLAPVDAAGNGCLDEILETYARLRQRIEQLIISHLDRELTSELKPFQRIATWSSEEVPQAQIASTSLTSAQLITTFALIKELFDYLSSVCAPVLVHHLYRGLAERLDQTLYARIVQKNNFSRRGALQLTRDLWEIWATFAKYVPRPEQGMRRLLETQEVLSETAQTPEEGADMKPPRKKDAWNTVVQLDVANRLLY